MSGPGLALARVWKAIYCRSLSAFEYVCSASLPFSHGRVGCKYGNAFYLQEKNRRKERQGDRDRERNLVKSKEEEGKWLFDR